jgi:hypothetical protein
MAVPRIGIASAWTRSLRRHHDPAGFGSCPEEAGRKLASSPAGPGSLGSSQQHGSGSPPVPPGAMGRETLSQLQPCTEVIRCGRWTPRRQLLRAWSRLGVAQNSILCRWNFHPSPHTRQLIRTPTCVTRPRLFGTAADGAEAHFRRCVCLCIVLTGREIT